MNRSIALFVALAVLVAHGFALHSDGEGGLAVPYDRAYVAFRLARNLVHEGSLVWLPGLSGLDAYPSLLWVGLCALAERLYLGVNLFAQALSTAFALATVVVAARFHPDRAASLIAPLLLAISGGMAAAGVSGLETTLAAFLLTGAFLAFDRGWSAATGAALLGLGLARPEGWILVLAFALLRLLQMRRGALGGRDAASTQPTPARRVSPWIFALPLAGFVLLGLLRRARTGSFLGSDLTALVELEPGELAAGLGGLWDFVRLAASPVLVLYAMWYLGRGRLSVTGTRALALGALWCLLVLLQGGGRLPFYAAWVPALPLLLIAAQEGMILALNSHESRVRGLAWGTFLGAVVLSALVSRKPADIGPLPLADWQRAWMGTTPPPELGPPGPSPALGREALEAELAVTRHLRSVGIFLRDHLPPDEPVTTPWPGAIGYLSRLHVHDLLGRATPLVAGGPRRSWEEAPRVDLLEVLGKRPPHVVPTLERGLRAPTPISLATELIQAFDRAPEEVKRIGALREILAEYELVTVPIYDVGRVPIPYDDERTYLLRRRELQQSPTIEVLIEEGSLVVTMSHGGHLQLAELRVRGRDAAGELHHLTPGGEFVREYALARTHLLVHATGERVVELIRARLPDTGPALIELEALLVNPGSPSRYHAFAAVSNEVRLSL